MTNADKPPLALSAALQRTAQFLARRLPLLLTVHAPTFVRKAPLLPDSVFVVGYGTPLGHSPSVARSEGETGVEDVALCLPSFLLPFFFFFFFLVPFLFPLLHFFSFLSGSSCELLGRVASNPREWPVRDRPPWLIFCRRADTAVRLVEPRFYPGASEGAMLAALSDLRRHRCRFLVAGRLVAGVYHPATDFVPPAACASLFAAVDFRADVSSTELRTAAGGSKL